MIKMFASDLDGTLLNALHEADGTIRRAIRELTEAGLHVVPATGRSTLPVGEHGFTGLALDACCSNGSIVRDSHGEVLKTWTIDPQVTEELLKAFPDICFDCSTPDGMFSSGSFEMHQAGFGQSYQAHRDARYKCTWRVSRGAVLTSRSVTSAPRCVQDNAA
ncbi:MAG: HAD family hydrolase [Collinsella sp.]